MIGLLAEVSRSAVFRRPYRRLFAFVGISLALALIIAPEVRGQCLGCVNASFGPASRAHGTGPVSAMKVADFNNDGIPDIAVVGSSVEVHLGDGFGVFSLSSSYTLPYPGNSIAVGDFNGDGKMDLAVAWPGGTLYTDQAGEILVFFGDGAGGLSSPSHLSAGFHPWSVVAADFNGDGNLDLASGSWATSAVSIIFGDGKGGFAPAITIPTPSPPIRLTVGDINGDGVSDLAVVDQGVHFLLGSRSGSFQDIGSDIGGADVLADVNGDGLLDVVGVVGYDKVAVYLGHGDGTFDPPFLFTTVAAAGNLAVADFNRDGRLDLIVNNSLFLGDSLGGFTLAGSFPGSLLSVPGDFDGDGFVDVASAINWGNYFSEIIVSFGTGDGHFLESNKSPLGINPSRGFSVDLNADGKPDLLVLDSGWNLTAVLGDGAGGFGSPVTTHLTANIDLVVGDFDEDGFPDIVAYGHDTGYYLVFLHGDGAGHFGLPVRLPAAVGFGLVVGDFNGDHHLDIAIGYYQMTLLFGDGTGHFGPPLASASLPTYGTLVTADLNGDGKADLVLFGGGFQGVFTLLGTGQGGFVSGSSLTDIIFNGFLVADLNGDGIPDLATTFYRTLSVRFGDGAGGFGTPVEVPLALPGNQIVGGDFNGDGKLDLEVGGAILQGDGAGGFRATDTGWALPGQVIAAADFTGDGKPDLVGWSDQSLWLLPNTSCEPRHLQVSTQISSCGSAGVPFAVQPVVRVADDGGNLVACDSGSVAAAIVPGTGAPGANLGGTTTVTASGGVASFSNLSIDLPGRGYELRFTHPRAHSATSRSVTLSLAAPTISGATATCTVGSDRFDGGAGYDSYRWALDGVFVGDNRFVTVGPLAAGPHTLQLTVNQDGCQATASVSLGTTASPPAPAVSNNGPVPFAGTLQLAATGVQGATYRWSGPNGFSSSFQNPSIPNATPLQSGRYQAVAIAGGCASSPAATDAVVLPAPPCAGCSKASFAPAVHAYPVDYLLAGLAVADFNRDGIPDVATVHDGNQISLLLGNGRGSFAPPIVSPLGLAALSLSVADLNGDGFPDAVMRFPGGVMVALGNPSGVFSPPVSYAIGYGTSDVAVADVNRDGIPDLVVTNSSSNTVSVLIGNGSGGFAAPVGFVSGTAPSAVVVGDFNADGKPDLLVANQGSNSLSIFLGDGAGGFSAPSSIPVPGSPFSLALGDVVGDGSPDILVGMTSGMDQLLAIYQGSSSGAFSFVRSFPLSLTGPVVLADINGDGHPDLLTLGADGLSVRLWHPPATGPADVFSPPATFFAGGSPVSIGVGDFNADGLPDIAAGTGPQGASGSPVSYVSLLFGDGHGGFTQTPEFVVDRGARSMLDQLVVRDLNHDGHPDLLASVGNHVSVFLSDGAGGFLPPAIIPPPSYYILDSFAVADVDGDGEADLIELDHSGGHVSVFPGSSAGTFGAPVITQVGRSFVLLGSGDFNGDGRVDLLISDNYYIPSPGISVLLGNGAFGFGPPIPISGFVQSAALAVADFNKDGRADIAVCNAGSKTISVYPGDGTGHFGAPVTTTFDTYPTEVVAADFNGDGNMDLVVQTSPGGYSGPPGHLWLLSGDGAGGFISQTAFADSLDTGSLTVVDFNGDGKPDLAANLSGRIELFANDGHGGFAAPSQYIVGTELRPLSAADFDGDGRIDLAVPDLFPAKVHFLFNTNCVPGHLGVTSSPSCPAPGQVFSTQPVIKVFDDGDNVVACDGRTVTAAIVPGTGTPGAALAGTKAINVVNGVASFSNLSIDLAGPLYRLQFHHPVASPTRSSPFSVGAVPPPPTASNSGPVCAGQTLQLSASSVPGAVYRWSGPNGFSSGLQSPSIPKATIQASGTYSVMVTVDGCTSTPATTTVTVNATQAPTASNNGPICAGQTLQLNASDIPGATYAWTGPSGFASTEQNPQILSAPQSASGKYLVVATANTCPSPAASTTVTVRALPSAAISAAATVCAASLNTASVPATAGATYNWTIANGTITAGAGTPAITFMAGLSGSVELSVTVTSVFGCAATGSKSISIVSGPSCPGFYTVTPCRVIDTRYPEGPLAGPALSGGTQRTFLLADSCGIPATARAVSANIAVTQAEGSGHLMIYPGGASPPDVSVINFSAGDTRSNNAILVLGSSGDITVYTAIGSGLQVDFILDVNGYFQ